MKNLLRRLLMGAGVVVPSPAFTVLFEPLTNSTGTVTTRAYINAAEGSSTITPSVTVSRDNGSGNLVAPIGVHFDATATTSTSTSRPFHDLEYFWDFGDSDVSSTWGYGAQAGAWLKNEDYGPVVSHVYESAGTFTPTLLCRYRNTDGTFETAEVYSCPAITVITANTEWATTKTVCYSTTADFTGAPSGATQVQVSGYADLAAALAANKGSGNLRHLLHRAQTFSGGSVVLDTPGPSMLGAFGTGAKPIISSPTSAPAIVLSSSSTPTTAADWRIVDIAIDNNYLATGIYGAGSTSNILMLRVDMSRTLAGIQLNDLILNAFNTYPTVPHPIWDDIHLVDSSVYDLGSPGSGPNGILGNATRMSVMGNSFNNNGGGEHCIRFHFCQKVFISHNTLQGAYAGKHHITLRGIEFAGTNTFAPSTYSEKNVISDNKLIDGSSGTSVALSPQFVSAYERGRNMIVERNWFVGDSVTEGFIKAAQTDITVRNNLGYIPNASGGSFVAVICEDNTSVNKPTRVNVYNNTLYHASAPANFFGFISTDTQYGNLSGSTIESRGNVFYAVSPSPNVSMLIDFSAATITQSNNTTTFTTTPTFATDPPTLLAHFTLGAGGYAQGGGYTDTRVVTDFYGVDTQVTPDMGAVRI